MISGRIFTIFTLEVGGIGVAQIGCRQGGARGDSTSGLIVMEQQQGSISGAWVSMASLAGAGSCFADAT